MPASNMEVYRLMERMYEALTEVAKNQPRHQVAEAIVRVAASFVVGCAKKENVQEALLGCAMIFAEVGTDLLEKEAEKRSEH